MPPPRYLPDPGIIPRGLPHCRWVLYHLSHLSCHTTQQFHIEVLTQENWKRIFMQMFVLSVPRSIIHNCPDCKQPRHPSAEARPLGCVCGHSSRPAKARTARFLLQELRFLLLFQVKHPSAPSCGH